MKNEDHGALFYGILFIFAAKRCLYKGCSINVYKMIRTLHALRFVFILLIMLSHVIGSAFDFGGECGVSFFFMLSGFVLSLSYGSRVADGSFRTRRFVGRQLLKFYPLHLVTLAVFVWLDARLGRIYDWQHLVPNVLLLQSWIPSDEYFFVANGASWFLCDIVFFYSVFACMWRWLNGLAPKQLAVAGGVTVVLYAVLAFSIPTEHVNAILYAAPWTRLLDFCIGILICRFYQSERGQKLRASLNQSDVRFRESLTLALLVASFFAYEALTPRLRCAALFWVVIPPPLLFYAAADRSRGVVVRLLHHPVLQRLGDISLEIYLLHMLVFREVHTLLRYAGHHSVWLAGVLCLVLTIPVAWLVKRYFTDKVFSSLERRV